MISKEEIKKLAELARLELGEAEATKLQTDISNILDYVGQVSAVAAEGEREVPLHRTVMREDIPRQTGDILAGKEDVLRAAFPEREGDHNVVRKIIQKDE